jgi:hypothetical protein
MADDEDVPPVTDAPDGQYAVMRGVQGPKGMFSARVALGINLSAGAAGEPVSLAPDLFFSVTDKLQLGLLHQGPLGWQARPGNGICLTGEDGGCPKLYNNLGLDLMYGLLFDKTHLSARGTLFFDSLDPATMHLALGVMAKLHFGTSSALVLDPKIAIAVDDRDTNPDQLYIPVELQYQARPATTLKLLSGIYGNLDAFGDTYQVPLGVGAMQNLTRRVDLGLRFSFDNLLGAQPEGVGRADLRSLIVLLNLRS